MARAVNTQFACGSTLKRVLRNVPRSQVNTVPKTNNRKAQPDRNQQTRMMQSDHAAPTYGFANDVNATVPSRSVRAPFRAVSTTVKGLIRIKTLITCETRNTTRN